jgi:hypothetical protein
MRQACTGKIAPVRAYLIVFLAYGTERGTVRRALKVMLVVGTLLTIINHGQDFVSGTFSWHWIPPIMLTYLLPFCVATYGDVQGRLQHETAPMATTRPDQVESLHSAESGCRE